MGQQAGALTVGCKGQAAVTTEVPRSNPEPAVGLRATRHLGPEAIFHAQLALTVAAESAKTVGELRAPTCRHGYATHQLSLRGDLLTGAGRRAIFVL